MARDNPLPGVHPIEMTMFQVLGNTILPVFSIILLGYGLKLKGVIPFSYIKPTNQIVYYVAIPAMLFNAIAKTPFGANFHVGAVGCIVATLVVLLLLALVAARALRIEASRRATFVQSCFHGNIGYMSYAIVFYALGDASFARMAILSGFLIVFQNILSIWTLTTYGNRTASRAGTREAPRLDILRHAFHNPIILTVFAGLTYSTLGPPMPHPVQQFLNILGGMALPTALLLIGASLSFRSLHGFGKDIVAIGALKLVCLPVLGYAFMRMAHVPDELLLSAIILLASPPATVTYVMAVEMGGDPELAATSVSVLTLISALSYSAVLSALP